MPEPDIVNQVRKQRQIRELDKARRNAEAVQNQRLSEGITLNESGIKNPFHGAARAAAVILGGERAMDAAYQMKFANLITDRAIAAHQNHTTEVHNILMGQVVVLEAIITRHSQLLGLAKTEEMQKLYADIVLRAQNELRKTLLAIDQIQNPKKPTQFIKTYVAQQLNQLRTDLLESPIHEPLAIATTERPEAIRANSPMAALEEIHRS